MKPLKHDTFIATPYDIIWRIRDTWLGNIKNGLQPVSDELIPSFEIQAASILRREPLIIYHGDEPDRLKDHEIWRLWWMNEVQYLSTHGGLTPDAKYELPATSRNAINVLNAASELRAAIKSGDSERTALFSILLITEALDGGYSELELAKDALDKREENGIGKINAKYGQIERACVQFAKQSWSKHPSIRIGVMVENVLSKVLDARETHPGIIVPTRETIKKWIVDAGKNRVLNIPPDARKGGRPKERRE